jgi:hypothetical protein
MFRTIHKGDIYRILVRKREGKRSLGRPRLKREDNIKNVSSRSGM